MKRTVALLYVVVLAVSLNAILKKLGVDATDLLKLPIPKMGSVP